MHLIETGRVRPSRHSLEVLAARLGRPASDFLIAAGPDGDDPDLEELEQLCQRHQYERLLDRAEAFAGGGVGARPLALAHFYAGLALHHLNRQDEALERLGQAEQLAESHDDARLAAEAMDWRAVALHRKGDLRALELAQEALRRYRQLELRQPHIEARMIEHVGNFLVRRRDFDGAEASYREALQVLAARGAVYNLQEMGRLYHGLAGCARAAGDLRRATELMQQAVSLYSVEHELWPVPAQLSLPKARNDLGLLLLQLGQLERAEELLQAARAGFVAAGETHLQAHVLLSLGELRRAQGCIDEAFAVVREAIELSSDLGQVVTLAVGHQQLGELHAERGEDDEFDASFQRALELLGSAGLTERRAQCQAAYERLARLRVEAEGVAPV